MIPSLHINLSMRGYHNLTFSYLRHDVSEVNLWCFKTLRGFTNFKVKMMFQIDKLLQIKSDRVKQRCTQIQLDCIIFYSDNDVDREYS